MNLYFQRSLLAACAAIFLAVQVTGAETNAPAITRDELTSNYLQIQEQLHAAQIAIEQNQEAALETSQSNAVALAQRLQSLEQTVARQRDSDAAAAHKTQELTLLMAGLFGLAGLGIMLLMVYFQWRAFSQLAQISSRQHASLANSDAVHQLAAPGRATVEASTAQLLNVVGRLEQRINELESSQKLLPDAANANGSGSFSYSVVDSGGTANGGVNTTTESIAITVNAVNDAPVRTAGSVAALTVNEDATATSLGLGTVAYGPGGGADEVGGRQRQRAHRRTRRAPWPQQLLQWQRPEEVAHQRAELRPGEVRGRLLGCGLGLLRQPAPA